MRMWRFLGVPIVGLLVVSTTVAGCVSRGVKVDPLPTEPGTVVNVATPVKAHLNDGRVAVFEGGVAVSRDTVRGEGQLFSPLRNSSTMVRAIPLSEIVAMESFSTQINAGRTAVYSLAGVAAGALGTMALAVALFGSCPTIYADSAGTLALQAESFSSSISPLLEGRDIDRLQVRADSTGRVVLHVWNEAVETHYINHLELLEIAHRRDELVMPDERGRPLALRGVASLTRAVDRSGRDVLRTVARADEQAFVTSNAILAAASSADHDDYIDITAPVAAAGDSVAVVFRLRSSLLNTVAFYDLMLGRPGARSLDWLASDLQRLDVAAELGRWYDAHFGMRVSVPDGAGGWREVARLHDFGPVAWRDVALIVPAPAGDSVRLRVSFLADQFRIDQVRVASELRRVEPRFIQVAEVRDRDERSHPELAADLRDSDDRYLITGPGQRFSAVFDVGIDAGEERSYFVAAQGWYSEWVRTSWIREAGNSGPRPFSPSRSTIDELLRSWEKQRETMEATFYTSRVPVN
jgi:hypothetical protein